MTLSASRAALVAIIVSIVLHLIGGWAMLLAGTALGGYLAARRGALVGLLAGAAAWTALAAYSFVVAPGPTGEMTRVMAALAGGLPAFATLGVTVLAGAALGLAGGWFGSAVRNIVRPA
ncbi:MAG: hypothetical protein JJ896_18335 [Rhodothermales bacterium]|nr:hypothetical protein [Rhodothermales bacterium]MBO6781623.1 hypothetical protein [Rhodothermales bacterium]